jgi:hypothetical protein
MLRCVYEADGKLKIVDSLLDEAIKKAETRTTEADDEAGTSIADSFYEWFALLAAAFKDSKFKGEEEYRLVTPFIKEGCKRIKLRANGTPYVPFKIRIDKALPLKLAEVLIGPNANKDIATNGLRDVLGEYGVQSAVNMAASINVT